jgi:hypothetical protein
MRAAVLGLLVMFALASAPVSSEDVVRVKVSPSITTPPATVVVRVTVAHDADNRELEVVVDGLDYYRSSSETLEGADAPFTHLMTFTGLPAGTYRVDARVHRVRGMATSYAPLMVVGAVSE